MKFVVCHGVPITHGRGWRKPRHRAPGNAVPRPSIAENSRAPRPAKEQHLATVERHRVVTARCWRTGSELLNPVRAIPLPSVGEIARRGCATEQDGSCAPYVERHGVRVARRWRTRGELLNPVRAIP